MVRSTVLSFLSDVQKEQTEINQAFVRFTNLVKETEVTDEEEADLVCRYEEHLDYLKILYIRLLKLGCAVLLSQP